MHILSRGRPSCFFLFSFLFIILYMYDVYMVGDTTVRA